MDSLWFLYFHSQYLSIFSFFFFVVRLASIREKKPTLRPVPLRGRVRYLYRWMSILAGLSHFYQGEWIQLMQVDPEIY